MVFMNIIQPLNRRLLLAVMGVMLVGACDPKVDNRGYVSQKEIKEQVIEGKTTKDEVMAKFGSPSSQSSFGDETWYYISARKETWAFLKPEVVEQQVCRISFDAAGIVMSVQMFDKGDSKDFALAKRTTPTEGHTLGFFEQVLGNMGRFNRPGTGNDTAAPGRKQSGGY